MLRLLAASAVAALVALAPRAQTFTNLRQDARTGVLDITAQGHGNAVAAAPTLDSPFFSNPAHLARTERLSITALGVTAGAGGNVREAYDYYDQTLGPAIEEGLEQIRETDPDRLQDIYDEALLVGRAQKTGDLALLAPSARVRIGQVVVGAGVYGSGVGRARISDGGAGIPYVDAYTQADVLVPVGVAGDVPGLPFRLSAGATATYVQRRIGAKAGAIDSFDPDNEKLYILRGDGLRLGLGLDARDLYLQGLDVGLAVTDVGGSLGMSLDDSVVLEGSDDAPDDAAEIRRLEARFNGRGAGTAVRLGAAYRVEVPAVPEFPVSGLTVMADYTSNSTSEFDQSFQAGFRAGARARVARVLDLRVGLSQRRPTAGVGIVSPYARLDYATYAVEDGRLLGQQGRRVHALQVRFGLF